MDPKLKELRGKIEERRAKLHEIFEQAGADNDMSKVTVLEGDTQAKVEGLRAINDELDSLSAEAEPLEEQAAHIERSRREAEAFAESRQGHPMPRATDRGGEQATEPQETLGELFFSSGAAKEKYDQAVELGDVDPVAALFETGAGWAPETTRTGRIVEKAVRPIQITDIIPTGGTGQAAVVYMEETVMNNAAAEVAEAGTYAEAELKLVEKSSPVRKLGVYLPLTDEQIEDVPQAQSYINNRLPFMIRQRVDGQIGNGAGEAPDLLGFLNKEGINTQEKGADPVPDAIYKAGTKGEVTGRALRGPVMIHPIDWQDIRLMRTADGIYIWGSPSDSGPERIWGQQVVKTDVMPEGTALTGDFANFSELAIRRGIELKLSDSHSDWFIKGKQALRADMRVALVIYRPAAFTKITGI